MVAVHPTLYDRRHLQLHRQAVRATRLLSVCIAQLFGVGGFYSFLKLTTTFRKQLVAPIDNLSSSSQQRFWKSLLYYQQYYAGGEEKSFRQGVRPREPLTVFIDKPTELFSTRQLGSYCAQLQGSAVLPKAQEDEEPRIDQAETVSAPSVLATPPISSEAPGGKA